MAQKLFIGEEEYIPLSELGLGQAQYVSRYLGGMEPEYPALAFEPPALGVAEIVHGTSHDTLRPLTKDAMHKAVQDYHRLTIARKDAAEFIRRYMEYRKSENPFFR